jgi:hypothetical protein
MSKLNAKHRQTIRKDEGDRETYSWSSMQRYIDYVSENIEKPITEDINSSIIRMYNEDINEIEAIARINGDKWASDD